MPSKIKTIIGITSVLLLIIIVWAVWTIKTEPEPKGTGPITELKFWGLQSPEVWINYWNEAISRFEAQNTGVKVLFKTPKARGMSTVISSLDIAFKSNTAPDVFQGAIFMLATGAEKNWFEPLDRYIAKWRDKRDIIDQAYEKGTYKGKVYGIGFEMSSRLIVYRKDYFKEAGLDPERPPETWEEVADCAVKLTKRDGYGVTRSGFNILSDGSSFFAPFVRQNGGDFLTKDDKPAINSPEWVETLGYFTDLVANKKVNIITNKAENRANNLFLNGKAAISQLWADELRKLLNSDPSWREKIGIIDIKRKKPSVWAGCDFPFIMSNSKHKDLAWKFVKFIFSPDEMWQRYKETKCTVVRKSLMERYFEDDPFLNKAIWNGMLIGDGAAKVPWYGKMDEQISKAMEESFHEGKPPAKAMDEAMESLLKEIESFGTEEGKPQ
ncbi:MAG TPA: ABC transporter substrate-binding protein [Desulfatiglandales bacterium]|nr:ABC transporter substrate-binding protein [Desulfatiglandales bacterium]